MMFLKGIQWFEWLLIGAVVTMLTAGYLLWGKYNESTEQIGSLKQTNAAYTAVVEYQDQSATISDSVVATMVQEKEDEKNALQQSRTGVIDDYVNMVPVKKTVVPKVTIETPSTHAKIKVRSPEPKISVVDDPTDRITVLANRMHEHYCRAAPERGINCNSKGTNP